MPKSFEDLRQPYDNQITKEEYLKIAERRIREFDFEKIHSVMTFLDWKWSKKEVLSIPTVEELKQECERLIKEAIEYDMRDLSCGGFTIHRLANDLVIEFCMSPRLENSSKDDSELIKAYQEYVAKLQDINIKNIEIISKLISSNNRLRETLEKITVSKSSELWARYFKELDSGNPRECVLNSLVELIKWERTKPKLKSDKYEFLIKHCKNGEFQIYCNKKYDTTAYSLEGANAILKSRINDARITDHVIYDYYEETCKKKIRR